MNLRFLLEGQMGLKPFAHYLCIKFSNCNFFFIILGVTEVYQTSRLLQTVLFKTDSVFDALLACFDETIGLY